MGSKRSKSSRGFVLARFRVLALPLLVFAFAGFAEQPVPGVYIVALSEHVTYWDHQGWKDPFDSQQFTARQQQYGLGFNLESIYTPQLVIDGSHEFIGSDERSIEGALRIAATTPKAPMEIQVDVKRGENANKTLKHSGVVRILQSAGSTEISSKKISFKLSPDWHRENLRVVAFVQSRKDRRILSVASAEVGTH